MSFPSVDRAILSAKDKKNLAGAQELTALLTDLDVQRHKVQHALKDLAEYLPVQDGIFELAQSVIDKYRSDFDNRGFIVGLAESGNADGMTIVVRGDHQELVVKLTYLVEVNKTVHVRVPVCETKCLAQYDDCTRAFTFYLVQDLVDHLESVFLSVLAG